MKRAKYTHSCAKYLSSLIDSIVDGSTTRVEPVSSFSSAYAVKDRGDQ